MRVVRVPIVIEMVWPSARSIRRRWMRDVADEIRERLTTDQSGVLDPITVMDERGGEYEVEVRLRTRQERR